MNALHVGIYVIFERFGNVVGDATAVEVFSDAVDVVGGGCIAAAAGGKVWDHYLAPNLILPTLILCQVVQQV